MKNGAIYLGNSFLFGCQRMKEFDKLKKESKDVGSVGKLNFFSKLKNLHIKSIM